MSARQIANAIYKLTRKNRIISLERGVYVIRKEGTDQLSENRLARMEKIDSFLPEAHIKWEMMYSELVKFKKEYGHCKIPNFYPKNQTFGNWVARQRSDKKGSLLDDIRTQRLEEIGFTWENPLSVSWQKMYSELVEFKKEYGHCDVPKNMIGRQEFYNWIAVQRTHYRKGKLRDECVQLLDEIGFQW